MRASRTACRVPTSTASTSCGRCRTPRPATATRSPGQTVINVTNGKLIRLLVDDEPFDVRYGELRAHERCLDFRAGVLHRTAEWVSPAGRAVRVSSTRLVSFVQRSIARDLLRGRGPRRPGPGGGAVRAGRQRAAARPGGDPRAAAVLERRWSARSDAAKGARAGLVHSTRHSGLRIAAVMDHVIDGPADTEVQAESFPHLGRVTVTATLEPGQRLRLVKFVAYGWSGSRSLPAVRDQADAALAGARRPAGTACCRAAGLPGRVLGPRRRRSSTATPRSSRRCGSRCSTCCRPAPAPRAGRSPPRA